jgi:hypothetical protein
MKFKKLYSLPLILTLPFVAGQATPVAVPVKAQATVQKEPEIKLLHTSVDAVGWTFDAILQYPEEVREDVRFVYLPEYADQEWPGIMDLAINIAVSHSPNLVKGDRFANGYILGYNFHLLCPEKSEREEALKVWDSLASRDSTFHLSNLNLEKKDDNLAILAPHLASALAIYVKQKDEGERLDTLVARFTDSPGAIYPYEFLLEQLLTSKQGKYVQFRQLDQFKKNKEGQNLTQLQNILADRGFFVEAVKDRKLDKGAWINRSGITGKNRIVLAVHGFNRTPMTITFDVADERQKAAEQYIRNLLDFNAFTDAQEVFIPLPNGLVEYLLTDGKGNVQAAAPGNIVADSNKPDGHTKELEMGMSCILCHFPENGYKTLRNDIEYILGSQVDLIGDKEKFLDHRGKEISKDEAVEIVSSRFRERLDEPDGILGRAKRDFVQAVNYLTDYQIIDKRSPVQRSGEKIKEIYHNYRYRDLDAQRVCLEMGVIVPKEKALMAVNILFPPVQEGLKEDPLVGLFKNGLTLKRLDYQAMETDLAARALDRRHLLLELLK